MNLDTDIYLSTSVNCHNLPFGIEGQRYPIVFVGSKLDSFWLAIVGDSREMNLYFFGL